MSNEQDRSKSKQTQYLSKSARIEERTGINAASKATASIAMVLILLVGWAASTKVKETAVTFGEIIPRGQVKILQHLEGGIVEDVLVQDGQKVEKGQILLRMAPTAAKTELARLQSREISLLFDAGRLRSKLKGEQYRPDELYQKIKSDPNLGFASLEELDEMLRDEQKLLDLQKELHKDQRAVLTAQVAQQNEELKQFKEQKQYLSEHLRLLQEEANMYNRFSRTNPISRRDYLAIQRQVNQAKGELTRIDRQKKKTQQMLREALSRLKELKTQFKETTLKELGEIHSELLQVRKELHRAHDRVHRLKITSPTNGIVKGLEASPGRIIDAAGKLLEIVPLDQEMVAETKLSTRDIGHIKIGDPVDIKVITYDFARYGSIKGKVTHVSATTFLDEKNRPYYKVSVLLKKNYVGHDPKKHQLLPGMTVEADIITGEKTILVYLLKPIHASIQSAFHER